MKSERRLRAAEDPSLSWKPSRDWKAEIERVRKAVEDSSTSEQEHLGSHDMF